MRKNEASANIVLDNAESAQPAARLRQQRPASNESRSNERRKGPAARRAEAGENLLLPQSFPASGVGVGRQR